MRAGGGDECNSSNAHPQEPAPTVSEFVDALWVATDNGLLKIDSSDVSTLLEIPKIGDIKALDIDDRRGLVWVFTKNRLRGISFGGEVRFTAPKDDDDDDDRGRGRRGDDDDDDDDESDELKLRGDRPFGLQVNSNTGTVWLGLGRLLYQFDSNANLVQILRLPDKGEALALDELTSLLWVATRKTLSSYDETGAQVHFIDLGRKAHVEDIAIDPASGDIWVVQRNSLSRLDASGMVIFETPFKKLTLVVTDYQDGAWLARDKTLLHVDPYGNSDLELKPFGKKGKELLALAADPLYSSVWVASKEQVAQVSVYGEVLQSQIPYDFKKEKEHLRDIALYVDVIAPEIAFTAPPQGFVNNNRPALMLSFTDIGEGVDTSTLLVQTNSGDPVIKCDVVLTSTATCAQGTLLPDGLHTRTATIQDLNGNLSAPAEVSFTVDTIPPIIRFVSPLEGAILTTDFQGIRLEYSDLGSEVDPSTLTIQANGVNPIVSCEVGPNSARCSTLQPLPEGLYPLMATIQDLAGNPSAPVELSFTIQLTVPGSPVLDPIGDQVVPLGSTLTLNLTGTDPEGDPLAFSAAPLPLPENSSLNASSGLFTFTPSADQVGVINQTFIVSDGVRTDSETIDITVQGPAAGGVTSFTGRVLDANDFELGTTTPVVGATISFLGTALYANSDSQGNFTVTDLPAGSQVLDIDTSMAKFAPNGAPYAGFREELELIADVNNIVERPFFLPRIDTNSLTQVDPDLTTIVMHVSSLGVVFITVPPHTAKNPDGTDFMGQLSISLVPRGLAPAALPDFLDPGLLITIQPVGITFATPVPITFPNIDELIPGIEVDIWSLDADLGVFSVVGTGKVSNDKIRIETISDGIRATDWHFVVPQAPSSSSNPDGSENNSENQDQSKCTDCPAGSQTAVSSGNLGIEHSLASYRSFGQSRALRLIYNSLRAHPQPVTSANAVFPLGGSVPLNISSRISVAGVDQGTELFTNAGGLLAGVEFRQAVQFDASSFETGVYPFRLTLTGNFVRSAISNVLEGSVLINNQRNSPFGAGWTLEGLGRLTRKNDKTILTEGDGSVLVFTEAQGPPGDFSTLVENGDGTFTRTLKDGIQINFDADGLQTSIVDRNGNETTFAYDASDRLISITDPAGLVTTLSYSWSITQYHHRPRRPGHRVFSRPRR